MLHRIGPKTFFEVLRKSIYEQKTVYHYRIKLDEINTLVSNVKIENKIYCTFNSLDKKIKEKIKDSLGSEKLKIFKERLNSTSDIVVTFIKNEFASYCFFAYTGETFQFFTLPEKEIYFYDCFTFPQYRGRSSIYFEVKFVMQFLERAGFKYANVEIESSNIPSIRAFAKVGFCKTKEYRLKRFLFFERRSEK